MGIASTGLATADRYEAQAAMMMTATNLWPRT